MAEYYNDIYVPTSDSQCFSRSNGEFQKCAPVVIQCSGEQFKHRNSKPEHPTCSNKLNRTSSKSRPLLPIEPIVKSKSPISFINDMICYKRRRHTESPVQALKSHVVRPFKFTSDTNNVASRGDRRIQEPYVTNCFTVN